MAHGSTGELAECSQTQHLTALPLACFVFWDGCALQILTGSLVLRMW